MRDDEKIIEECTCLWVIQHACVFEEDREKNFSRLAIAIEVRQIVHDHEIGSVSGEMVFEVQKQEQHDDDDDLEEDLSTQEFRMISKVFKISRHSREFWLKIKIKKKTKIIRVG